MPKRVIDFDAMWGSDKLASCAEWAQAEYAWLYGLADASGCFELTNLRVVWGRVAAIRRNLSLERLEQIFHEFRDKGLLFVWEEHGKQYGHWTGSDVPGRLPAPSWRVRLERLAPPVPKQHLAEFMSRFSRGRASSQGGGFFADPSLGSRQASLNYPSPDCLHASLEALSVKVEPAPVKEELNECLESAQAQDWKWDRKQKKAGNRNASRDRAAVGELSRQQPDFSNPNSNSEIPRREPPYAPVSHPALDQPAHVAAAGAPQAAPGNHSRFTENAQRARDKAFWTARELVVGQGPQCGPVRVKPEVLARIRSRNGARSP